MKSSKKIVELYDYRDINGNLIMQTVRFQPKGFAQRRPYEDKFAWGLKEGWYQGNGSERNMYFIKKQAQDQNKRPNECAVWLNEVEPILYQLPDVHEAISKGETVFVCEGEKDVNAIRSLGLTATTNPMGAGKWKQSYSDRLKTAKEIVVLADKDEIGKQHANEVVKSCYEAGIRVKLVELPDIDKCQVKDVSDWISAGGDIERLKNLINECPYWLPNKDFEQLPTYEEQDELFNVYGKPYYKARNGIVSINETFWAGLNNTESNQLYEPDEKQFYRYEETTGLYKPMTQDVIKQEINSRVLEVARENKQEALEKKRSNSLLNNILGHLKGIAEKRDAFSREDRKFIHLANGIIDFKADHEADFIKFYPSAMSRNASPIAFDETAKCPRFLDQLIIPAMEPDDVILLQKIFGQCLLGDNPSQKLVIFDGEPNRGKSTISNIIQAVIGKENVAELRTRHLGQRFETYRYLSKTLLIGVDVPADFLSFKGAKVIKALVGGDRLDAEQKGGNGVFQIIGNFNMIITSNSRLRVTLEGDIGAYRRRVSIIRFCAPKPEKKINDFDKLLVREEGSGILNWAIQGVSMLFDDLDKFGEIQLTDRQMSVVDALLAESDSLRHFLEEKVESDLLSTGILVSEILEKYAEYCPEKGWNPKPITELQSELPELMLELFRTVRANSVETDSGKGRGFRKVRFKDIEQENDDEEF